MFRVMIPQKESVLDSDCVVAQLFIALCMTDLLKVAL